MAEFSVLKSLYEIFLQERRYLKNGSPKTLGSYGQAWNSFESVLIPVQSPGEIRVAIKTVQLLKTPAKVVPTLTEVFTDCLPRPMLAALSLIPVAAWQNRHGLRSPEVRR
jgi:hypothetical protein